MKQKLTLGLTLFGLGILGILTLLTTTLPLDSLPKEVLEKIPPTTLQWIILINPVIMLLIAVVIGTFLHEKVNLSVPTVSRLLGIATADLSFKEQLTSGAIWGTLAGVLTSLLGIISQSYLPSAFVQLGEKLQVTPLARFGYGGITEELLIRYGFMTLFVWLVSLITKQLTNSTYWIGIIVSSLLFALGHFPIVYQAVPNPSLFLLMYVLLGNIIAGLFLGWLYWKKGLEAAMIGHIFAHIMMLLVTLVSN